MGGSNRRTRPSRAWRARCCWTLHGGTRCELPTGHPAVAWALRRSGWLLDRFQPGDDGQTPYYRHHGRNYQNPVLPFAETVLWREPGPHLLKLKSKWGYGIWLGRTSSSDSHAVATHSGAMLVRGVRRLAGDARNQVQELLAMRGTPARMVPRTRRRS